MLLVHGPPDPAGGAAARGKRLRRHLTLRSRPAGVRPRPGPARGRRPHPANDDYALAAAPAPQDVLHVYGDESTTSRALALVEQWNVAAYSNRRRCSRA